MSEPALRERPHRVSASERVDVRRQKRLRVVQDGCDLRSAIEPLPLDRARTVAQLIVEHGRRGVRRVERPIGDPLREHRRWGVEPEAEELHAGRVRRPGNRFAIFRARKDRSAITECPALSAASACAVNSRYTRRVTAGV